MERRYEFTLWICVMALGIHYLEEYALDLRAWLEYVFVVQVTWEQYHVINLGITIFIVAGAVIGWRVPELSLMVPAILITNAVLFHGLFSIVWMRYSPGAATSILLFVPAALWTFDGARRDRVLTRRALVYAFAGALFWHLCLLGVLLVGPPR